VNTRSPSDRENGNVLPLAGGGSGRAGGSRRRALRGAVFGLVAAAGVFGAAASARAETVVITTNTSNYTMGTSASGHSGGGEWGVSSISNFTVQAMGGGGAFSGNVFQSFCLERNESLSPGTYNYTVSTGASSGGVGGATAGVDPISAATAWLFATWYAGNLSGYNYSYGAGRVASAGELQDAFWLLENELSTSHVATTTQAWTWYQAALNAGATGIGNVRVLTLTDSNGGNHQDILVMVPLPSAALLGLGLMSAVGAVGLIRRRKNHTVLA
jgi:hypothetical protein